jgi:hypothetical protein
MELDFHSAFWQSTTPTIWRDVMTILLVIMVAAMLALAI